MHEDTENLPSNLSPCPCPRHSGETAIAATSPHLFSKYGKSAAQAIICPSLSTTMNESICLSNYNHKVENLENDKNPRDGRQIEASIRYEKKIRAIKKSVLIDLFISPPD